MPKALALLYLVCARSLSSFASGTPAKCSDETQPVCRENLVEDAHQVLTGGFFLGSVSERVVARATSHHPTFRCPHNHHDHILALFMCTIDPLFASPTHYTLHCLQPAQPVPTP